MSNPGLCMCKKTGAVLLTYTLSSFFFFNAFFLFSFKILHIKHKNLGSQAWDLLLCLLKAYCALQLVLLKVLALFHPSFFSVLPDLCVTGSFSHAGPCSMSPSQRGFPLSKALLCLLSLFLFMLNTLITI